METTIVKTLFSILAVLALFVGSAVAQNGAFAPYVSGGVTYSANTGTTNPGFVGGLGIESSTKHLLLDLNGTINTANPTANVANLFQFNGKGYTGKVTGSVYLKVKKYFLIGGGAYWQISPGTFESVRTIDSSNYQTKLDATLQSAHPFIGGGFQTKYNRLLATYALPGKDAFVNEKIIPITNEFFVGKHLRLTQSVTIVSSDGPTANYFEYTNGGIRLAGTEVGAGVKFVF